MNDGLAIISLLVTGWSFGLLTAWYWDDRTERKLNEQPPDCGCHHCRRHDWQNPWATVMVVCSICGNKRCPHASDHRLSCTGSNEPGQPGSVHQ